MRSFTPDEAVTENLTAKGLRNEDAMTDEEIAKECRDNHIWLNAFACVRPTPEFLQEIGRSVLSQLEKTTVRDGFTGGSPVSYLRVNKS